MCSGNGVVGHIADGANVEHGKMNRFGQCADDVALHIHGCAAGFAEESLFLGWGGDQMVGGVKLSARKVREGWRCRIDDDVANGQGGVQCAGQARQNDSARSRQQIAVQILSPIPITRKETCCNAIISPSSAVIALASIAKAVRINQLCRLTRAL